MLGNEDATLPKVSEGNAGIDLHSSVEVEILPRERKLVQTNLSW